MGPKFKGTLPFVLFQATYIIHFDSFNAKDSTNNNAIPVELTKNDLLSRVPIQDN